MKIRAVTKDRSGRVVRDLMYFEDDTDLERFRAANKDAYARAGWQLVQIENSPLTAEEITDLELLRKLAGQANALVKHFHFDADMVRRWKDRQPKREDIALLSQAFDKASARFCELAIKEYGVK